MDVIQWNMVVTNIARVFTHWLNYKTEEAYERALIRQLFVMDFMNYYTWFFSLCFVYVIPGFGEGLTNYLNYIVFNDPLSCCFGPSVGPNGYCIRCPGSSEPTSRCFECKGWFTFDRAHVDLSAMFVTPIIVTQGLNMLIAVVMPIIVKKRRSAARAKSDAAAQKRVIEAGSMKILGSLEYRNER